MAKEFKDTPEQAKQLDKILDGLKGVPGPTMIALQKAQDIYGYLPFEIQNKIAENLSIPVEEVYGIVTFYSQFSTLPKGKYKIGVCMGTACYVRGSGDILDKFKEILKLQAGQTSEDLKYTLEATRCIGCCGLAPVLTVNEEVYGKVKADDVKKIIAKYND